MSDTFYLYINNDSKPQYFLVLETPEVKKCWMIPARKDLNLREFTRIATETDPPACVHNDTVMYEGKTGTEDLGKVLVQKGNFILKYAAGNKLEFCIPRKTGSILHGRYVFLVPSWGRNTHRKVWTLIPV